MYHINIYYYITRIPTTKLHLWGECEDKLLLYFYTYLFYKGYLSWDTLQLHNFL